MCVHKSSVGPPMLAGFAANALPAVTMGTVDTPVAGPQRVRHLLTNTRLCAHATLALVTEGAPPTEALDATGLLRLFACDDALAQLGSPMELTNREQRLVVLGSCADLSQTCDWLLANVDRVHPFGKPLDAAAMDLGWTERLRAAVGLFRELAACAPQAARAALSDEERPHELRRVVATVLASASPEQVRGLDRWTPDASACHAISQTADRVGIAAAVGLMRSLARV